MKHIVKYILKLLAGMMLKKHKPRVIAVTGSVGKTTTKEAMFHVLNTAKDIKVLTNKGNYNNEFGLPLTILEEQAPIGAWNWIKLVFKCYLKVLNSKSYYDILVLEMGSDGPGDIVYLARIAQPDISIVTNVERVHLLNFKSIEELAHEKSTLIHTTKEDGMVILNYDNSYTKRMIPTVNKRDLYTFGLDKNSDIQAFDPKDTKTGLTFKVRFDGKDLSVKMPHVIGKHNVYTILPVFPICKFFGVSTDVISKALKSFKLPSGRMGLIEGINDSYIIDSSYNAEPSSMKAAITTLKDFPEGKRRIAVIGDMLELGLLEESSHREVGKYLRESMIDLVFFVGPKMKWAMDEMNSSVRDYRRVSFYFSDSFDAAQKIAQKIKKEDVILVKGSRGMLMERVVHRLSKR